VTPALIGGVPDTSAPYTIMTYTGALTGDATNFASGLPTATRYTATFDTTTTPGSVLMSVTGTGENLVWSGATTNTWNTANTPLLWNADAAFFQNLDIVTFNDTADGTGAVTVNLVSTVQPGAMTVNNPTRAYTFSGTNGVIAGGGSITKRGAAGLTLAQANTFTGGMTVVDGSVTLTNVTAAGTGTITLSHPDTNGPIVLKANVGSGVFNNPITVSANGTGTVTIDQDNNFSSLNGTLTLNRATSIEGAADRSGIGGKITGNVGTLTFTGVRTTLDNTVQSDFTGNIEIASGAVVQPNAMPNALPPTASINISGTGRFQLNNGHAQTINALTGGTAGTTGVQIIAGSATTLTVGAGNGSGVFNGNIINNLATLSLVKTGSGTQTLGGVNTYSGTTRVLGGTLALTNASALSGTTLVWDNEGGSLGFGTLTTAVIGNISGSQNLSLAATSLTDLTIGSASNGDHCTYTGAISLPAGATFTKTGNGNLVLGGSGSSAWTGNTRIITTSTAPTTQASLHLAKTGGAKAIPANTIFQFGTGTTTGNLQANLRCDQNDQFGANVVMVFGNAANNWTRLDLRGTTQTLAGVTSGNLTTLGSGIIQGRGLDTVSSGLSTLILNGNVGDANYPVGGYLFNGYMRDVDSGTAGVNLLSLVKSGTGTQALIGANITFSGSITVNQGKLTGTKFGASDANRTFTVNSGATLEFGASNMFGNHNTVTVPTIVINSGTLTNSNLLSATNGPNNGLRNLVLNSGTLTATVGNGTSLIDAATRPGEGYGAWGLNGTVTSTGTSSINVGSLTGTAGRILLSSTSAPTIFDVVNGTLTVSAPLQRGDSATNNGLVKSGAGTMILTAENLYTGNTAVNGGTLQLSDNAQLKFVIGASGVNNGISGTGTVVLDGDFVIDTTAANALNSGSWTLVDTATLNETFGASFSIAGFTDAGNNKWTRVVGSKLYTFDEATGILTLKLFTFEDWIAGFGLTGADALGTADPDKDGIANAVEMVLGGNPATVMDAALLPTIELVNADPDGDTTFSDYLLFTYRRTDLSVSAGVTSGCETNTDLGAVWTAAVSAPGVVILTNDNYNASFVPPATADTDRVRVYVPRGTAPKIFGRLNVTTPAPTP
jgi:autotransporter-associated beta strand protein